MRPAPLEGRCWAPLQFSTQWPAASHSAHTCLLSLTSAWEFFLSECAYMNIHGCVINMQRLMDSMCDTQRAWRGVSWATAAVLNTIGQSVYIQQQGHAQTTLHYTWVGRAHSWSMGCFRVFQRVPFIFSKVFFRGVAACIGLSLNCLDRYLPLSYKAVVLKLFLSGPTAPTKI